jgi:hypothetical protein
MKSTDVDSRSTETNVRGTSSLFPLSSSLSSPSPTPSPKGGEIKKTQKAKPPAPLNSNLVITAYFDCFRQKYGSDPAIKGKPIGQLNQLTKDYGHTKAIEFIGAYLDMPDEWFMTKRHDVATMMSNLNAINHFIVTGKLISRRDIQKATQQGTNQRLLDEVERGEF